MMFGDGTVDAMFSADEITPAPVALQDRVRYLQIAITAVLTSEGASPP
jgi:hypothetical protein